MGIAHVVVDGLVGQALLRHRDAEQRLPVYYLLRGIPVAMGIFSTVAMGAIRAASGASDSVQP
ncbi:MAG: hypothetical protein FJ265_21005 [Planctomycetes bacterium]|nr:hypothetical protein [Planctomycetota bacterium]